MKNNQIIKATAAVALGASLVTTAVAPGAASAATTVKTKNGKLVNAKTGKAVQGFKTYKGVLYKDGKKYKGVRSGKFYNAGKLASGEYKGVRYQKGNVFSGVSAATGEYFKNGVLGTGVVKGVYYKKGQLGSGEYKGVRYQKGKKFNGASKANGLFYKNGKLATGEVEGVRYYKGELFDGVSLANGNKYENGQVVAYKEELALDAAVAEVTAADKALAEAIATKDQAAIDAAATAAVEAAQKAVEAAEVAAKKVDTDKVKEAAKNAVQTAQKTGEAAKAASATVDTSALDKAVETTGKDLGIVTDDKTEETEKPTEEKPVEEKPTTETPSTGNNSTGGTVTPQNPGQGGTTENTDTTAPTISNVTASVTSLGATAKDVKATVDKDGNVSFTLLQGSTTSAITAQLSEAVVLPKGTKVQVKVADGQYYDYGTVTQEGKMLTITPTGKNGTAGVVGTATFKFVDEEGTEITTLADAANNEMTLPTISLTVQSVETAALAAYEEKLSVTATEDGKVSVQYPDQLSDDEAENAAFLEALKDYKVDAKVTVDKGLTQDDEVIVTPSFTGTIDTSLLTGTEGKTVYLSALLGTEDYNTTLVSQLGVSFDFDFNVERLTKDTEVTVQAFMTKEDATSEVAVASKGAKIALKATDTTAPKVSNISVTQEDEKAPKIEVSEDGNYELTVEQGSTTKAITIQLNEALSNADELEGATVNALVKVGDANVTQKFGTITVAADKKTITITPINDNATEGGSNITTGHAGLATTVTFKVLKDGNAIELKDEKNNTTAIPTITLTVTPSTKYAALFASDYTVKADLTKNDSNIKTAVITELNKTLKLTGDEALTADAVKYVSKDQAVVQLESGIKAVIALEQLTDEEIALQDYFSKVNVEENNGLVKVKYDAFNDTTVTTLNNWYADAKIEYTVDGQTKTAYLSDANLSINRGSVANQTETREFEISKIVAALGITLKDDTVYDFKVTPVLVNAKTGKVTEDTKVESGTAKAFTYTTASTVASATADYFEKVAVSESEGTVTVTYNPLKDTTASLLTGLYADAEIVVKKGTVQTEKVYLSQANGNKRGLASEQTGNKPFSIPTVMSAIEGLSTLPKGEYTVELTPILVNAATTQAIGNDTTIYKGTPTTITYEK